jgi:hypothetical protein
MIGAELLESHRNTLPKKIHGYPDQSQRPPAAEVRR